VSIRVVRPAARHRADRHALQPGCAAFYRVTWTSAMPDPRACGRSVIRRIIAGGNLRGCGVHGGVATRAMWITYDMKLP
jgi:hypothetical protein